MPYTPDGPHRFDSPLTLAACEAVALGGSEDYRLMGPKKIDVEPRGKWGRASAEQLKRVWAESEGGKMHLLSCVDAILAQCGVATYPGGGGLNCGHVQ